MQQNQSQNPMAVEPVPKLMARIGLPIVLSMILQAAYNVVDSAYLARMATGGETALNAELLNLSPERLKQQAQAVAERALAFRKRLEAARNAGIKIPSLCFLKGVNEIGACRICVVEVKGAKTLVASCVYPVSDGMEVWTNTPRVRESRKRFL